MASWAPCKSLLTAVSCCLQLQQFTFNAVGGASGEANNQAVATLAGIPPEDIKLAEWHNSVMRPCHYIAVDRANHCIVLSIRCSRVRDLHAL